MVRSHAARLVGVSDLAIEHILGADHMKVLVIGSGAREHALVRAFTLDPDVAEVHAVPGNPGIARIAAVHPDGGDILDPAAMADLAESLGIDLVVVGPEAPLVAGVADALRERDIATVGPSKDAARLEGSKAFAKEVMAAAAVPTAMAQVCTTDAELDDALDATGAPYVVKDDGLAGGKGVVVTNDLDEAIAHGRACLAKSGGRVVVEEFLDGPEFSVFCLSDGTTVSPLAPAQDFKRVGDGGVGPNTGGMGAYSPLPWIPDDLVETVITRIAQPTIDEMRRRGAPFVGILYVGLALTSAGPRVVEFNARLGDPDGQVSLARMPAPAGQVFQAAARGRLEEFGPLPVAADAAVSVVLANSGYPDSPVTGGVLTGIDAAEQIPGTYVLHGGTATGEGGDLIATGGRVLCLVSTAPDLAQARERVYEAIGRITLADSHYRTDIALAAVNGTVHIPS